MARFDFAAQRARITAVIDAEGLRPLARRAGVELNQLRSIKEGRDPSAETWLTLMEKVLGLELYVGPVGSKPEPGGEVEIDGTLFAALPLYNAEMSAGPGASVDAEEVVERLAFRHEWLARIGVKPGTASLVKVRGDSMAPTLLSGDLVLIDQARIEGVEGKVYALVDVTGDTKVKRVERPDRSTLILRSDNPAYPLELRRGPELDRLRIIGEVRWSGHVWR
jgi:phage repressor protein C with HTH and peptisase S24 domain